MTHARCQKQKVAMHKSKRMSLKSREHVKSYLDAGGKVLS